MIGRFLFLQIFKAASLKPEVLTDGSSSTLLGKIGIIALRIFLKSESAVYIAGK